MSLSTAVPDSDVAFIYLIIGKLLICWMRQLPRPLRHIHRSSNEMPSFKELQLWGVCRLLRLSHECAIYASTNTQVSGQRNRPFVHREQVLLRPSYCVGDSANRTWRRRRRRWPRFAAVHEQLAPWPGQLAAFIKAEYARNGFQFAATTQCARLAVTVWGLNVFDDVTVAELASTCQKELDRLSLGFLHNCNDTRVNYVPIPDSDSYVCLVCNSASYVNL